MSETNSFIIGQFGDDFKWGAATASYQIEGAWNIDGKGQSIWDTFSHTKGKISDGSNGDIAGDSYHKYEEDIQLLKEVGVSHYRFSFSWPRILPNGTEEGGLNKKGIEFYRKFLKSVVDNGLIPVATLYHWDLPQALQDKGGWISQDIVNHFVNYARICFREFGDIVKFWITFNEPTVFTFLGYGVGTHAPGIKDPLNSPFKGGHNVIKAHALTYKLYNDEFRKDNQGIVGITLNSDWYEPKDSNCEKDKRAADLGMQCKLGWFANPIFGDGDYPQAMKVRARSVSAMLGFPGSFLPQFTPKEIELNKGSADFFGLNYYTSRYVSMCQDFSEPVTEAKVIGIEQHSDPSWKQGESEWLKSVPWGLRKLVKWIHSNYNAPDIYITENGFSDKPGVIEDTDRCDYLKEHLQELLKAKTEDGVNLKGYFVWSLIDNFEWNVGYLERFGIYHVDFEDPNRKRTAKKSATVFSQIVKNNGFTCN